MSRETLPQDYKLPAGNSGYSKIEDGENTFRILSDPLIGRKYRTTKWAKEWKQSTSLLVQDEKDIPWEDVIDGEYGKQCKYTWIMVVRDYKKGGVSILEISTKKVLWQLLKQRKAKWFSDPTTYDITITKTWAKLQTNYDFTVSAPEPVTAEMKQALLENPIDLTKMLSWDNPYLDPKSPEASERRALIRSQFERTEWELMDELNEAEQIATDTSDDPVKQPVDDSMPF